MSNARWCDLGQHAFPEGQAGANTVKLQQYVKNQWGGSQPYDVVQEVCRACSRDAGMRNLTAGRADASESDADRLADAIRDGSSGQKFSAGKQYAIENGDTPKSAEEEAVTHYLEWRSTHPKANISSYWNERAKALEEE